MKVYLVKQNDYSHQDYAIYVCSTLQRAIDYAEKLNRLYATDNVHFNKQDGTVWVDDDDYEDAHYYDVSSMELDEPLA